MLVPLSCHTFVSSPVNKQEKKRAVFSLFSVLTDSLVVTDDGSQLIGWQPLISLLFHVTNCILYE